MRVSDERAGIIRESLSYILPIADLIADRAEALALVREGAKQKCVCDPIAVLYQNVVCLYCRCRKFEEGK